MPALPRGFEVIAVDQRGMGLSDEPEGGCDTGAHAADLIALMDALGHQRFAVVGHDTGFRSATRSPQITRTGWRRTLRARHQFGPFRLASER